MKHHRRSRRPRRYRRPLLPLPTRSQVRQRLNRLSQMFATEALLELAKPGPDAGHLQAMDAHVGFFNQCLGYMEMEAQ